VYPIALAIIAMGAFGQSAPEPSTKFSGQIIGETVAQWIAANHWDLSEICGPHKRNDKRMDFKAACTVLSSAQSGKSAMFETVDSLKNRIDWYFEDGKVSQASIIQGLLLSSVQEQIAFLTDLYGPPSRTDTVHNQNALGGKWDTVEVSWNMPDGALIAGIETLTFTDNGPFHSFTVSATSREMLAKADAKRLGKPNPYAAH
jgi:hypothetical protein